MTETAITRPSVTIVGGGYAGIAVAQALDEHADVTLIEPREHFFHNVGALRALVDPEWSQRLFFDYSGLLARGRVLRDRVVAAGPERLQLGSGQTLHPDFVVLATGSAYPFPAKLEDTSTEAARERLAGAHDAVKQATDVLLLGAGPVGLELAGEISSAWPDKRVTIVDPVDDILGGAYLPELRAMLREQLETRGVRLLLGQHLAEAPATQPGELQRFEAHTAGGADVSADVWFQCFGVRPATDYVTGPLGAARTSSGQLRVNGRLQVDGQTRVFAVGDVTDVAEPKRASVATGHAEVVADTVRRLAAGQPPEVTYTGRGDALLLPLGPGGGATQLPMNGGTVLGPEKTAELKGQDLLVGRFAPQFTQPAPA